MRRKYHTEEAARIRVEEILQQSPDAVLDVDDEPTYVIARLLVTVIGDHSKCQFVTSNGTLKWNASLLAKCLGYNDTLARRAVKSAFGYGATHCGDTKHPATPRLKALRQTVLDELRRKRAVPLVPSWGRMPKPVQEIFRDFLLRSYTERRVICEILENKRRCPRELNALLAPLAKWSEDDLRQLKSYLV